MHHPQACPTGRFQFGIGFGNSAADHHQRCAVDARADGINGGGVLLLENPGSLLAQQLRLRRLLGIRAGDVVAALRQDPGDGRHANTADPNEMNRLLCRQ